jgi:hypothetical protein
MLFCMGSRCRLGAMFGFVGLGVVFGVSAVFAADWYAKDNLQPATTRAWCGSRTASPHEHELTICNCGPLKTPTPGATTNRP